MKGENADTTTIEPRERESESERRETVDGFRLHVHVELHVICFHFKCMLDQARISDDNDIGK